jgi:hypothetical protein
MRTRLLVWTAHEATPPTGSPPLRTESPVALPLGGRAAAASGSLIVGIAYMILFC